MKNRQQLLSEKAQQERQKAREWLLPFLQNSRPKTFTKDELRAAARRDLHISNSSFDFAWIDAIESTGRPDWYQPLPKRCRTKQ